MALVKPSVKVEKVECGQGISEIVSVNVARQGEDIKVMAAYAFHKA